MKFACVVVSGLLAAGSIAEPIEIICDEFAQVQVAEMTAVVRAVEEQASLLFGKDVTESDDGATIELHLQYLDYKRIDKELNNGRFRRNWGFANGNVRQAHIALQPPVPTAMMDVVGLPLQTKIEIAHEAVHLCIYRAFPNHRSHTGWLSEGLSVYLAEQAIQSIDAMGSQVSEPWTSTEIVQTVDYFEEHPKFGIDELLDDVSKDIPGSRMYAMRGLFMDWLHEIGLLKQVVDEARRLGGGDDYGDRLHAAVDKIMADAGIEKRDAMFRSWLGAFEPQWEQLNRSLETNGDIWPHSAFSSTNANCWNAQELGDDDWAITGEMKIFDAEKTQMNILVGRSDTGYVSIAVTADWGVTVFHRQYSKDKDKGSKWVRIENQEVKSNSVDKWMKFKVSKRRDRLMIKIGKQRPIRVDVSEIDVSGAWGLGVQNKSAGLWRDVKVDR